MARLSDQDLDNVSAEVVYPNAAMFVYSAPDPEYRRECLRAYNSWLAEYCSVAPDRIIGVAMLPVGEPQWALGRPNGYANSVSARFASFRSSQRSLRRRTQ